MTSLAVIVNPISGGGRGQKVWQMMHPALRALFDDIHYRVSNKVDDLGQLTKTLLLEKPDYLLIIGGDGTLSCALNGLLSHHFESADPSGNLCPETQIAYFNSGCGGDFARQFPTQHVTDFLERLKNRQGRSSNIGKICFADQSIRYFINIASCGLSADIAEASQQSKWMKKLGGQINYFVHALLGIMRLQKMPVRIWMDDNPPMECDMLMMAVCNGPYFGGGMHIAPMARIDDGLLDVVIFHDFSKLAALTKLPKIYTGSHLLEKKVHYVQAKRLRLESLSDTEILVEADGEKAGKVPVSFELLPQSLHLIV